MHTHTHTRAQRHAHTHTHTHTHTHRDTHTHIFTQKKKNLVKTFHKVVHSLHTNVEEKTFINVGKM